MNKEEMGIVDIGRKTVFGLLSLCTYAGESIPVKHGELFFSSLDKLKELCPWRGEEDIIFALSVPSGFDDLDYVPDNY